MMGEVDKGRRAEVVGGEKGWTWRVAEDERRGWSRGRRRKKEDDGRGDGRGVWRRKVDEEN